MAMIKCRECGHEISSRAESCPYCGVKTRYGSQMQEKKEVSAAVVIGWVVSCIGTIIFLFGLTTMLQDISDYHDLWAQGYNYKSPLTEHEMSVIMQMVIGIALDIGGTISIFTQKKNLGR